MSLENRLGLVEPAAVDCCCISGNPRPWNPGLFKDQKNQGIEG